MIGDGSPVFIFDVPAGIRLTMRGPNWVTLHDYPAWVVLYHVDSQSVMGFVLADA